ncbi:MAG: hypothetical protein HW389_559 [Bacteroidetes bacterium]|nr:hypothetical protein [Bacteroidota bacterium]
MGRTSLLMVMGYSVALILMGFSLSQVSTRAYENSLVYHDRAVSHSLAASLANMGCNVIYRTPNAFPKWTNVSLGGGIVNLNTKTVPGIAAPGSPTPVNVQLMATSDYGGYKDTVIIEWGVSSFGRFAYYSGTEGAINWATADTVFGPFHTQDKMTVNGSPVFWGKVTNKLGLIKNPTSSTPKFFGGYQTGIDIPMPSDFNPLKNAALANGKYLSARNLKNGKDLTLTFNSDSTMTIKGLRLTDTTATDTIVSLRTFVPNGALVIDTANVRIKGKFAGTLTLSVQSGGSSGKGKMYLDSSVAYVSNPLNGASGDVLGLCATDSIVITNNSNNSGNVTIQAALFSLNKGLGVEQYNNGVIRGRINLLGGISQKQRAAVGTLSGGVINSGFSKSYRYDNRLMTQSPPFYPTTGSYMILSWYER